MKLKHVQAELRANEYRELAEAAEEAGMTLKEALRQAVVNWSRQRTGRRDPWYSFAGIAGEGPSDDAERHDDIYLED